MQSNDPIVFIYFRFLELNNTVCHMQRDLRDHLSNLRRIQSSSVRSPETAKVELQCARYYRRSLGAQNKGKFIGAN